MVAARFHQHHGGDVTVHLLKLCVGADGVDDLLVWQAERFSAGYAVHVTRMWPRREREVLDGGSLFWVFRGEILARQRIRGLDRQRGEDGVLRCAIALDREAVPVRPVPRRPFQGWRYLEPADAPADLAREAASGTLPAGLAAELAELGVV